MIFEKVNSFFESVTLISSKLNVKWEKSYK